MYLTALLSVFSFVVSCATTQTGPPGAAPIFDDGFENANEFLDLFPMDVSRWTTFFLQPDGNLLDLTTEQVHSGVQALRCFAQPFDGITASKAYIGTTALSFASGAEVWTEIWVHVVGGTPPMNVFLWDLEAPGTCTSLEACPQEGTGEICSSPGRRLYLSGPAGVWLKSDLGKWCIGEDFQQTPGQELALPVDEWVRLRTYQRLSEQADGVMKVWQNDDLIIDAIGITLPRDDSVYTSLQVGITANGDETNAHVVYLDDVRVWDQAPAWWIALANEWTDHPANPVVVGDLSSPWMQLIGDPEIMKDGDVYKMWFAANIVDGITEIAYATSVDGVSWNIHPQPVIQVGGPGSWDRMSVETPTVVKNADGTYALWYSGLGALENDPNATLWDKLFKIGHAVSPDGIHWTKDAINPVMDIDLDQPSQWDSVVVADPHVIREGSTYRLWYTGVHVQGTEMVLQIGYATSLDGTNWTRYAGNPVLPLGAVESWDSNMIAQPGVFFDGEKLIMLYMGNDGTSIGDEGATGDVGLAFSVDGINWQRSSEPVLRKGAAGAWNDIGVWGPTGMFDEGIYKMWYAGVAFNGQQIGTGIGHATSEQPFPTVPTVSVWGVAVMILLLLAIGTVVMPRTSI